MTLSKFLTYWSLLFAILTIWVFSVVVAFADVKDELLARFRKQWAGAAKNRFIAADPLAGRAAAETLTPRPMTDAQEWVLHQVSPIASALKLDVKTLVLQDSQGHFVVHLSQGKRLVTYRVDKAWVADARAGKADQLERIRHAVEQYLRQEFLGEKPAPRTAPAAAAQGAPAAAAQGAPAAAAPSAAEPGTPAQGPRPAQPERSAGAEMSREERIAAAKAKAEALKAQRAAGGSTGGAAGTPPAPSTSPAEGGAGSQRPADHPGPQPPSER